MAGEKENQSSELLQLKSKDLTGEDEAYDKYNKYWKAKKGEMDEHEKDREVFKVDFV